MEPIKESGLGFFLKNEREKKGLTRDHVARVTRLRRQYIDALEDENWDRLPSRVFIKGFIKTYTKALGLDYREVMGQFESVLPVYDDLPKPLVPPKPSTNKYTLVIVAGIIAVCIVLALFLKYFASSGDEDASVKEQEEKTVQKTEGAVNYGQSLNKSPAPSLYEEGRTSGSQTATSVTPGASVTDTTQQVTNVQDASGQSTQTPAQTPAPVQTTTVATTQAEQAKARYNLAGYVTSKTYILIYVDNEPPKEYIFEPGNYPQWTASEGFYIVVGNAGGIAFDFNGKSIKGLGTEGEVVRLRLPGTYSRIIN